MDPAAAPATIRSSQSWDQQVGDSDRSRSESSWRLVVTKVMKWSGAVVVAALTLATGLSVGAQPAAAHGSSCNAGWNDSRQSGSCGGYSGARFQRRRHSHRAWDQRGSYGSHSRYRDHDWGSRDRYADSGHNWRSRGGDWGDGNRDRQDRDGCGSRADDRSGRNRDRNRDGDWGDSGDSGDWGN